MKQERGSRYLRLYAQEWVSNIEFNLHKEENKGMGSNKQRKGRRIALKPMLGSRERRSLSTREEFQKRKMQNVGGIIYMYVEITKDQDRTSI